MKKNGLISLSLLTCFSLTLFGSCLHAMGKEDFYQEVSALKSNTIDLREHRDESSMFIDRVRKLIEWAKELNEFFFYKALIAPHKTPECALLETGNTVRGVFSIGNDIFASTCHEGSLKVWSSLHDQVFGDFKGHLLGVETVKLLVGGMIASSSRDGTIKIWDLSSGQHLKTLVDTMSYATILTQIDENLLASATDDRSIKIWDLNTGQVRKTFVGHEGKISVLVSLGHGKIASASFDKTVRIWDMNSGDDEEHCSVLTGHTGALCFMELIDDNLLATAADDSLIKIWDLARQECKTLSGHAGPVHSLVRLSGDTLASASDDGTVKIWNFTSGACLDTLTGHENAIGKIIWLGGDFLATESCDYTLKIWDLRSRSCFATLHGAGGGINSFVALDDGTLASATCADSLIRLWHLYPDEIKKMFHDDCCDEEVVLKLVLLMQLDYVRNAGQSIHLHESWYEIFKLLSHGYQELYRDVVANEEYCLMADVEPRQKFCVIL